MNISLYARVSSDRQDVDLSISAQLRALREYAEREGHVVVREFVDEAESGRTAQRPVFQEMVRLARQQPAPFSAILVWKLSRFARNREDSIIYKSLLRKHGVRVISINEQVEDSPTGRMLEGIIESLDEYYSANLAQDVIRGMRESVRRGFWVQPNTPFGYRRIRVPDGAKQRAKLEPEERTAPTVRRMFAMAQAGLGTKEITKQLNAEGLLSPQGKHWGKGRVHAILTSPVYAGTLVWGERGRYHQAAGLAPLRLEGAVPALVDRNVFDEVQELLHGRAPAVVHPRRVTSPYLLSGFVFCGGCGARMSGHAAKSGRFHYYACGTAARAGRDLCDAKLVPQPLIERLVVDRVRTVVLEEEHIAELVRLINDELRAALDGVDQRREHLKRQGAEVNRRLDRLYEALETGALSLDDLAPRIKELRERQDLLHRAEREAQEAAYAGHIELVNREQVLNYVRDLRGTLTTGTPAEQRAFLKSFVRSVTVKGAEVTVEYTLPLPAGQAALAEEPVLSIVLSGGEEGTRTLTPVGTWS